MADRLVNNIVLSAFCREDEDYEAIKAKVIGFFPFDVMDLKLVAEKKAQGFNEKIIRQIFIALKKQAHIKEFLEILNEKLGDAQRKLLLAQKESRFSDYFDFFIRLDKKKFMQDKFKLTDSGDCVHVKINIAAFPRKTEVAFKNIEKLFS
ncbi:MAG: hypothetical protein KAT43_00070 [Nanoarchaeota archaeon]|nr:hypothetical protein [Nanoarchaeota archaeon]